MKFTLISIASLILCNPLQARPWFDGGDLSALEQIEKLDGVFLDADRNPTTALKALAANGANCVRLRLFVNPTGKGFVTNDLESTLALAKRAKDADQAVLLDFHYSDTWADPGDQNIPRSWAKLSIPELTKRIETYTFETLKTFEKNGVLPELVQIGNEIDGGMLWPHGKIHKAKGKPDWETHTNFLKAASRGVRRATPEGKTIRIVVHTATGGIVKKTHYYHRELRNRELDYDVIGLSYYPWWHGTLADLKENTTSLVKTFDKKVFVVEAGYPWNAEQREKGNKNARPFPKTPEGQAQFLRAVFKIIHDLPDERGIGVLWWHPDSINVKKSRVWMSGSCALWKTDGTPLPALKVFKTH